MSDAAARSKLSPISARSKPSGATARLLASWAAVALVAVLASVFAITATVPPATEAERATQLKENTLCPVCDGQSVVESNAPVANAIRRQIDELVDAGRSDDQIREFLAAQYGAGVNALPPASGLGALVWVVPVVAFAGGAAGLVLLLRRPSQPLSQPTTAEPTTANPTTAPRRLGARAWLTLGLVALIAVAVGIVVARSAGLARPGQSITGEINRSARSLTFEAETAFAQGDINLARQLIDEALEKSRDHAGALILSARLFEREGEVLSALGDLDRVLDDDPTNVDALTLRGWMLVRLENDELIAQGIADLDAAIAQVPDQFDPWVFRGFVARQLEGDLALAIEMYEAALERNPPPAMGTQLGEIVSELRAELRAELTRQR